MILADCTQMVNILRLGLFVELVILVVIFILMTILIMK